MLLRDAPSTGTISSPPLPQEGLPKTLPAPPQKQVGNEVNQERRGL